MKPIKAVKDKYAKYKKWKFKDGTRYHVVFKKDKSPYTLMQFKGLYLGKHLPKGEVIFSLAPLGGTQYFKVENIVSVKALETLPGGRFNKKNAMLPQKLTK